MERLFDQEIQRLDPSAKRRRGEEQDDATWSLPEAFLPNIFTFLGQESRGRASRVCTSWNRQIQTVRVLELSQLRDPELEDLLSRFGITIPEGNPSSARVSATCRNIYIVTKHIIEHIIGSAGACREEKEAFRSMDPHKIAQDPNQLLALLRAGNDHSLVMPFLFLRNGGPDLSGKKTLAEKAQAVRDHLRENGDRYTTLDCNLRGLLCVPREIGSLTNLRSLDLASNYIVTVPPDIARLQHLTQLYLMMNCFLSVLPEEVRRMKILEPRLKEICLWHGLLPFEKIV